MNEIRIEELKEYLIYIPEHGEFVWKIRPCKNINIGAVAGGTRKDGYKYITLNNKKYLVHRLVWLFECGRFPPHFIDHMDGNPSNNKIGNLREASSLLNVQNQIRPQKTNRSGYLGVHTGRSGYEAKIRVNGTIVNLGSFKTPVEAHEVYVKYKRIWHEGNTL